MPYPGVPDDKIADMESCVKKVMAEGKDKDSAIAICRDSIMGFTIEIVQDPTEINAVLGGSYLPGELLRWENMELARAEVNANRDELDNANITSIAETLPLMPIDDEHKQDKVVGIFTAARNEEGRLLTDGIIYARRYPDIAELVMSGKKKPSIEAYADVAVCSICGGEFHRASEYCSHLKDKHGSGAVRRFKGNMRGVGGGIVWNPAGSTASFDLGSVYMVASHEVSGERGQGQGVGKEKQGDGGTDVCVCPECGAETEHQRGTPCAEQRCPKCGAAMAGEPAAKTEGGLQMPTIEEIQSQLDEALTKLQKWEADGSELQTANAGLQASLDEATAKVAALESDLEALRSENESLVEANRRHVLASVMTSEEFDKQRDVVMSMSDEAVTLLAAKGAKAPKTEPAKQPVTNLDPPSGDQEITL